MNRLFRRSAVALTVVFLPHVVLAQDATTGSIEGAVTDSEGTPLSDVELRLTSAQGIRTKMTKASGQFRFLHLPAGDYGLEATRDGYSTMAYPQITVNLGARVRANVTLSAGSMETVVVRAAPIVVDIFSATTGETIDEDFMTRIPLGRSFTSTLALAPGVVEGGRDEGNPSIGGASGLENAYVVDGVSMNSAGYGSIGPYSQYLGSLSPGVNFDYVKQVQIKTGGYEPEYGNALGGVINVVTKTGGNERRTSVYTYVQSSGLEGERARSDRELVKVEARGFTSRDFGLEVSGPIVRDRIFYYGSFNPTYETTNLASTPQSGFDHEAERKRETYNYAGNQKWIAGPRHTVTVSAFGDPSRGPMGPHRNNALAVAEPTGGHSELTFGGNSFVARWEGRLTDDTFIEASYAWHQDDFDEVVAVDQPSGFDAAGIISGSGGVDSYGGLGLVEGSETRNSQYRVKLSNFFEGAGQHNLRLGIDFEDIRYDQLWDYTGAPGTVIPESVENGVGVGSQVATSGFEWLVRPDASFASGYVFSATMLTEEAGGRTRNRNLAFFLSDSWSPVEWINLMAGVRYEQASLTGNLQKFTWDNNWGPRFHVSVDPTRDHRSKISVAWGRFFPRIPNIVAVRALSSLVGATVAYDLADVDTSNPDEPVIPAPSLAKRIFRVGDFGVAVDPESKLTFHDELVVSAEREVVPRVSVGLSYTRRRLGRVLDDVQPVPYSDILAGADPGQYIITNPGPDHGLPEPSRKYDAVTLTLRKRFSEDRPWQVQGSYTWSRLRGNYEGYFRRDTLESAPITYSTIFDLPYLEDPDVFRYLIEDGPLQNDRTHVVNAYGSYTFARRLTLGANVRVQSGTPITKLGMTEFYYWPGELPLEERGASGRGPTTTDIGLHADYSITAGRQRIWLIADVFNVLNQQRGVIIEQRYEFFEPGVPFEDFGKVRLYQPPRSLRFAARVEL